ncbi:MAG: helix-turn-helix domain-containing protein, partial [Thermoanaerobaculia bacterium]
MDLVLKLRELRRMRGLSQREAALSSGIGEKTLSSFETGERIISMK